MPMVEWRKRQMLLAGLVIAVCRKSFDEDIVSDLSGVRYPIHAFSHLEKNRIIMDMLVQVVLDQNLLREEFERDTDVFRPR